MQYDKFINDPAGNPLASYGPRTTVIAPGTRFTSVEECEPDEAGFWGVYRHDAEGLADCIGDALDEDSARAFAEAVAYRENLSGARLGRN